LSFDQIGIVFTGMIAVWLTQDARESRRRWACIFGIAGQPFWLYATYKAGQWGILATCAYIKRDLQRHLPAGYHNPLRVPQHH
jgi:hypothetical protein